MAALEVLVVEQAKKVDLPHQHHAIEQQLLMVAVVLPAIQETAVEEEVEEEVLHQSLAVVVAERAALGGGFHLLGNGISENPIVTVGADAPSLLCRQAKISTAASLRSRPAPRRTETRRRAAIATAQPQLRTSAVTKAASSHASPVSG